MFQSHNDNTEEGLVFLVPGEHPSLLTIQPLTQNQGFPSDVNLGDPLSLISIIESNRSF